MPSFDLAASPLRELNAALHALSPTTNETHWVVANPGGKHAIACGVDAPLTIEIQVKTFPLRMKCSSSVALSLRARPFLRTYPGFRCVVVTVSTSPSHLPVEKPCQVCGAYSGGCGRPSIQIVRTGFIHPISV